MHYPIVLHCSMNISPLLAKYHQPHHRPQSIAGLVASLWGGGQGIRQVGAEGRHRGQRRWRKFPEKKQRNTSKNAETIWKSMENHGNILKQLLKTYGYIYMEQHGKNHGKKVPASPIWIRIVNALHSMEFRESTANLLETSGSARYNSLGIAHGYMLGGNCSRLTWVCLYGIHKFRNHHKSHYNSIACLILII